MIRSPPSPRSGWGDHDEGDLGGSAGPLLFRGRERIRVVAIGEGGHGASEAFSVKPRGRGSESHMNPWRLPAMQDDREKRDEAKKVETVRLEDASAGVRSRSRTAEQDVTGQEMKDLGGG